MFITGIIPLNSKTPLIFPTIKFYFPIKQFPKYYLITITEITITFTHVFSSNPQ